MIKRSKGKMLDDIPKSKLDTTSIYYVGIKYDGNYLQIHKIGNSVKFFTSGSKELYFKDVADNLISSFRDIDFIIEAEYVGNSGGILGDRVKSSTGTYRANLTKGISNNLGNGHIYIFDILYYNHDNTILIDKHTDMHNRVQLLNSLLILGNLHIVYYNRMLLDEAIIYSKELCKNGYEGAFAKTTYHKHQAGKILNTAIKLKFRKTADLLCIGIEHGTGKYEGMIGSLILKDSVGRTVSVGSGLDDYDRLLPYDTYIGQVIEIEYEQLLDTYIQPVFVCVRDDKTIEDID